MESRPYHYSYHSLLYIEWLGQRNLLLPLRLEVALSFETSTFVLCLSGAFSRRSWTTTPSWWCRRFQGREIILVSGVARIYTKQEDSHRWPSSPYHEADLEGEIHC